MKTTIEVTKATAMMMEAFQKKYEALCYALDAVEMFYGENNFSEDVSDKIRTAEKHLNDALWEALSDMMRDNALGSAEDGKIFTCI